MNFVGSRIPGDSSERTASSPRSESVRLSNGTEIQVPAVDCRARAHARHATKGPLEATIWIRAATTRSGRVSFHSAHDARLRREGEVVRRFPPERAGFRSGSGCHICNYQDLARAADLAPSAASCLRAKRARVSDGQR